MKTFRFSVEKIKTLIEKPAKTKTKFFFNFGLLGSQMYLYVYCIYYIHVSLVGFSCLENFMMILPQIHKTCSTFFRFQLLFDMRNNCCLKFRICLLLLVWLYFGLHFFRVYVWCVRQRERKTRFSVDQGHETRPKHTR